MAAAATANQAAGPLQRPDLHIKASQQALPPDGAPVNFVYLHVHNAIRSELVSLEAGVKDLVSETNGEALTTKLAALKERYTFLERIYKYHSSVEDEVCGLWLCLDLPVAAAQPTLLSASQGPVVCKISCSGCILPPLIKFGVPCPGCVSSTRCKGQECDLGIQR
jgi:hypothetical protein